MPIGPGQLLQLVKEQNLVSDLSERELTNPEGAGFDLRVGEIHLLKDNEAFLGETQRQTPETEVVAQYKNRTATQDVFTLKPKKYVLVKTIESVKLPPTIAGYLFPRSTLFRMGADLKCTQIAPGYEGPLVLGLYNMGNIPIQLEMGARIVHIQFEEVEGSGTSYRGQWKGGRVAAVEKETQV